MRAPPVLAIIIVLQTPDMSLNIPAAICWIRKTNNKCLKNLKVGQDPNVKLSTRIYVLPPRMKS